MNISAFSARTATAPKAPYTAVIPSEFSLQSDSNPGPTRCREGWKIKRRREIVEYRSKRRVRSKYCDNEKRERGEGRGRGKGKNSTGSKKEKNIRLFTKTKTEKKKKKIGFICKRCK